MTAVTPIRYVRDIAASSHFYAILGLVERPGSASRTWSSLGADGGGLGLHIGARSTDNEDADAVSLHLSVDDGQLEEMRAELIAAGYQPGDVIDETFGRFFRVADPDGYVVQIDAGNESLTNRSYETRESQDAL